MHELVHALQDQVVDLDAVTARTAYYDETYQALSAVVEGHATVVEQDWLMEQGRRLHRPVLRGRPDGGRLRAVRRRHVVAALRPRRLGGQRARGQRGSAGQLRGDDLAADLPRAAVGRRGLARRRRRGGRPGRRAGSRAGRRHRRARPRLARRARAEPAHDRGPGRATPSCPTRRSSRSRAGPATSTSPGPTATGSARGSPSRPTRCRGAQRRSTTCARMGRRGRESSRPTASHVRIERCADC